MRKIAVALTSALVAALACTSSAHADTDILTTGTPPPDYSGAVYVHLTDNSGINKIAVHYSWDDYVHIEQLPKVNDVQVLESFTCVNLRRCHDFISQTGTGDNAGDKGQPHVTIHRHSTLTFYPVGIGHTVVDEHYEHGIISWLDVWMKDGKEFYVYMSPPGTPTGTEYPDGLPHVLEWYFTLGAGSNSSVYGPDNS